MFRVISVLASILYSRCMVPTFLLEDKCDAALCGLMEGQVYSLFFGFLLLGSDLFRTTEQVVIGLALTWMACSIFNAVWKVQQWEGLQLTLQLLKARYSNRHNWQFQKTCPTGNSKSTPASG